MTDTHVPCPNAECPAEEPDQAAPCTFDRPLVMTQHRQVMVRYCPGEDPHAILAQLARGDE